MKAHVLNAIKNAELIAKPWPHFYVPKVFPDEFYAYLLTQLPPRSEMTKLGPSTPTRFLYWLETKGGVEANARPPVREFWNEFREKLFDDLWMAMEDKLGVVGQTIGSELLHDIPGYSISPHTDTPDKLVTGLFYLPATDEDAEQGTVLFHCDTPDPRGKGHKWTDEFVPIKTVPYLPNTGFFFQRTDLSYHGVMPSNCERWIWDFDLFSR